MVIDELPFSKVYNKICFSWILNFERKIKYTILHGIFYMGFKMAFGEVFSLPKMNRMLIFDQWVDMGDPYRHHMDGDTLNLKSTDSHTDSLTHTNGNTHTQ